MLVNDGDWTVYAYPPDSVDADPVVLGPVTVAGADVVGVDVTFTLLNRHSVSGRVLDGSGQSTGSSGYVRACRADDSLDCEWASIDSVGGYSFDRLADGVWMFPGTAKSIAVEYADHIVVIDAPETEARSIAVIDAIKKLIPGKPIRQVINTHHHFDHSGGMRACAATGATIIVKVSIAIRAGCSTVTACGRSATRGRSCGTAPGGGGCRCPASPCTRRPRTP